MPQRLPSVLTEHELPTAELFAARLDGELFALGDCFVPVDEIVQPRHRALALRARLSERLIAEQLSAAWIWGALESPPARHQLCVALGSRVSRSNVSWMTVREVVIEADEIALVEGMSVTGRVRTAVDLARVSPSFGPQQKRVIRALGVGLHECVAELETRYKLPNKRQAIRRLQEALTLNPS